MVARAAAHTGSGHKVGPVNLPYAHRTCAARESPDTGPRSHQAAGPPVTTDRTPDASTVRLLTRVWEAFGTGVAAVAELQERR